MLTPLPLSADVIHGCSLTARAIPISICHREDLPLRDTLTINLEFCLRNWQRTRETASAQFKGFARVRERAHFQKDLPLLSRVRGASEASGRNGTNTDGAIFFRQRQFGPIPLLPSYLLLAHSSLHYDSFRYLSVNSAGDISWP